jgi:hypothetical protein
LLLTLRVLLFEGAEGGTFPDLAARDTSPGKQNADSGIGRIPGFASREGARARIL